MGYGLRQSWVQMPALPPTSYMTLGRGLPFSDFSISSSWDDTSPSWACRKVKYILESNNHWTNRRTRYSRGCQRVWKVPGDGLTRAERNLGEFWVF